MLFIRKRKLVKTDLKQNTIMTENKIDLTHLAPYLPYKLQIEVKRKIYPKGTEVKELDIQGLHYINATGFDIKPILRPMSDLFSPNFNPVFINELKNLYGFDYLWDEIWRQNKPFNIFALKWACLKKLFEWHFDVFGLIEKGLAISIHDIDKK